MVRDFPLVIVFLATDNFLHFAATCAKFSQTMHLAINSLKYSLICQANQLTKINTNASSHSCKSVGSRYYGLS